MFNKKFNIFKKLAEETKPTYMCVGFTYRALKRLKLIKMKKDIAVCGKRLIIVDVVLLFFILLSILRLMTLTYMCFINNKISLCHCTTFN